VDHGHQCGPSAPLPHPLPAHILRTCLLAKFMGISCATHLLPPPPSTPNITTDTSGTAAAHAAGLPGHARGLPRPRYNIYCYVGDAPHNASSLRAVAGGWRRLPILAHYLQVNIGAVVQTELHNIQRHSMVPRHLIFKLRYLSSVVRLRLREGGANGLSRLHNMATARRKPSCRVHAACSISILLSGGAWELCAPDSRHLY